MSAKTSEYGGGLQAPASGNSEVSGGEEDRSSISRMMQFSGTSISRASAGLMRLVGGGQSEEEGTEENSGRNSLTGVVDVEAGNSYTHNLILQNPDTIGRESGSERVSISGRRAGAESTSIFDILPFSSKNLSPRPPSIKSTQSTSGKYLPTFRCGICLANAAETDRFFIEGCNEANHMFCSECMHGYIKSQVEAAITIVACPGTSPGCGGVIGIDRVRNVVASTGDEHLIDQVERFHAMNSNENFRECPKCNEPNTTGSPEDPDIVCGKCGEKYCFIHANAHPNMNCTQYAQSKFKEDKINRDFIEETTKECPVCKTKTYKNGGCNHMTCVSCHSDWCWICSQHIAGGGGAVTEHYTSGECAGRQFFMTADGRGDDFDGRLLIYRLCDIENPKKS